MKTRLRRMERPPGEPHPRVQHLAAEVRRFMEDTSVPPDERAHGVRWLAVVTAELSDEAVEVGTREGCSLADLATALGVARPTVQSARRRHRTLEGQR